MISRCLLRGASIVGIIFYPESLISVQKNWLSWKRYRINSLNHCLCNFKGFKSLLSSSSSAYNRAIFLCSPCICPYLWQSIRAFQVPRIILGGRSAFWSFGGYPADQRCSRYLNLPSLNIPQRTATTLITDFSTESQIRRLVWRIFGNWQPLLCLRCGRTDDILRSGM